MSDLLNKVHLLSNHINHLSDPADPLWAAPSPHYSMIDLSRPRLDVALLQSVAKLIGLNGWYAVSSQHSGTPPPLHPVQGRRGLQSSSRPSNPSVYVRSQEHIGPPLSAHWKQRPSFPPWTFTWTAGLKHTIIVQGTAGQRRSPRRHAG